MAKIRKKSNYDLSNEVSGQNLLQIQFKAPAIFRNMAQGRVDIHKHGFNLLNENVIDPLISVADSKYREFYIISYTMEWFMNTSPEFNTEPARSQIMAQYKIISSQRDAYLTALNGLKIIKEYKCLASVENLVRDIAPYAKFFQHR